MINREEAMKALTEEYNRKATGDGLKLAWIEKAINSVPGWIPTKERLPESDDMMLVTAKTQKGVRSVNRAYYSNGFWHGSGSMSNVIAWMPLPAPYEEEDL